MDLVIRNGTVVDGSGRPRFKADIGITDGTISAIGKIAARGDEEINADGAVVSPGFIDVHTHYDAQIFWDPMLSPSVFHGVTTVIAGHCGFTLAPLSGRAEDTDYLLRMLSRVEGMPLSTLRQAVKPDWQSFGQYLDAIDGKLAINTAFLVGHSAIRRAVMGERALTDQATSEELTQMRDLLRCSIEQGGVGFSTTVAPTHNDYEGNPVPSRVATREEIISLAGVLSSLPGTWLEIVFGVHEMNEEHYSLATDMSLGADRPINWNAVLIDSRKPELLDCKLRASDYARERGASVVALVPATPMITLLNFVNLFVLDLIPGWSQMIPMTLAERRKALADPEFRSQLKEGARKENENPSSLIGDLTAVVIDGMSLPQNQHWNGKLLSECARDQGKDALDALFDLVVEEDLGVSLSRPAESTDDKSWSIRGELWRDPRCLIGGSDAGAHLDMLNSFAFSTQLLGEGVRRRELLTLEDAVYRITALPAASFGLIGRGIIAEGAAADLVIFDPDTVDCGPIAMRNDLPGGEKRLYADSIGIHHVIVGGQTVAKNNQSTGNMAGKVLRSGRHTETVPIGEPVRQAS